MFRLDVLQNQWLLVAMGAGLALVLAVTLAYLAIWRPRGGRPGRGVPWIVAVVLAATAVFAVAYVALAVVNPPTW